MVEKNCTGNEEKRSLSFVEQMVEGDLAAGRTAAEYRHAFRPSPTDIYI